MSAVASAAIAALAVQAAQRLLCSLIGADPPDATLFYVYALFNHAFRYLRMGYASAMAWFLFAIVLALTLPQLRLSKRWVYYESGP